VEGSAGVFDTDSDGTTEIAVLHGWDILLFGYNAPGPLLPRSHRPEDWLADFLLMRLERPTALPDDVHLIDWLRYAIRVGVRPSEFWRLTPAELRLVLGQDGQAPLSRARLEELAAAFPDARSKTERKQDDG